MSMLCVCACMCVCVHVFVHVFVHVHVSTCEYVVRVCMHPCVCVV